MDSNYEGDDNEKTKYNLITIGNVGHSRTRLVISEKVQPESKWHSNTLKKVPDIKRKVDTKLAKNQPRNKRMMVFSSQHCTFDCQHSIKRGKLVTFDNTHFGDQQPENMATHQIRFDGVIFLCLSLITTLFNHGSQFDPHQLLNMLCPFSRNPEIEGRICVIQPGHKYAPYPLNILRFVYAMCKRVNRVMRDTVDESKHMGCCQGVALFAHLQKSSNTQTNQGRKDLFKLFFNKEDGVFGGIYEDMKNFEFLYTEANQIFVEGVQQIKYESQD